jgi:two-component system phosphate regulon sensor histidine kinase PhoR
LKTSGIFWRIYRAYAIVIVFALGSAFLLLRPSIYGFLKSERERDSGEFLPTVLEEILTFNTDGANADGLLGFAEGNSSAGDILMEKLRQELGWELALISRDKSSMPVHSSGAGPNFLFGASSLIDEIRRSRVLEAENFDAPFFHSHEYFYRVALLPEKSGLGAYCLVVGYPVERLTRKTTELWLKLIPGFLIALVVAGAVAYTLALNFSRPLELMERSAERFGRGEFKRKVPVPANYELSFLANSLNAMAAQLDQRIGQITSQRNEQMAILQSLREGVIALDLNEKILYLNHRAEQFLGVNDSEVRGSLLQEYIRHVDFQRFVASVVRGNYTTDEELPTQIKMGKDGLYEARSAPLRDAEDRDIGVIIILNDVTRLNQLETIRRDFVANVSHELRTPITSILGFTETLLDGALDEPEQARHFLEIIERQSNRLSQVIDDLLNLSRMEKETDLVREPVLLSSLLRDCVEIIQPEAEHNGTVILTELETDDQVMVNPTLIVQAISNLVGNAVRYTGGPGKRVWIRGTLGNGKLRIAVTDEGPGIAREHLPRLFERFYRVDKARSRDLGGTGLGLSIVQHVAHVHKGQVNVISSVEKGSTFTLEIPLPE